MFTQRGVRLRLLLAEHEPPKIRRWLATATTPRSTLSCRSDRLTETNLSRSQRTLAQAQSKIKLDLTRDERVGAPSKVEPETQGLGMQPSMAQLTTSSVRSPPADLSGHLETPS